MVKYLSLLIWLVGLAFSPLCAQPEELTDFMHFTLKDGLSHTTVWDMAQDKTGYMWLATDNGLNRYDGCQFSIYQLDGTDSLHVGNGIVRTCFADSKGEIWAGTDDGLMHYDCEKERFEFFPYVVDGKNRPVHGIAELSGHELLLYAQNEKLLVFDKETHRFSVPFPELADIMPSSVSSQGDWVYICSVEGVYIYTVSQKSFDFIPLNNKMRKLVAIQQYPATLWIGTEGEGLFRYDFRSGKTKQYTHRIGDKKCLSSNYVRTLALDHQGRLWIGTLNSLNIYDERQDCFQVFADNSMKSGNRLELSVRKIFKDAQGGMWLGTYQKGVGYYHPLRKQFATMKFIAGRNSLNCNLVNSIKGDTDGNLWIGTNGGGLNIYNPHTRQFVYYTKENGLSSNDVKDVFIDEATHKVYIATHAGGICILHQGSGQIEKIDKTKVRNAYNVELSKDGRLWVSGMRSFHLFNPHDQSFISYDTWADGSKLPIKRLSFLFRDSKRRLWLVGEKKLQICIEESDGLHPYLMPVLEKVEKSFVNCICESQEGIFWIGTRNGIFRFEESRNEVRHYTPQDGLASKVIHSILEDSDGSLWMGTDKGLSCFHPDTEVFRNYTDAEGLQSMLFTKACFRAADGRMYFGSIEGIVSFVPELLIDNPYAPAPTINRLALFGKTVQPGDATGILKRSVCMTQRITLTAAQSMFSLDFVVPNYVAGNHNTFAYMLEGYDKDWIYSDETHSVSYSNLPQGTYRFRVKAANNDKKWSDKEAQLEIQILPVWYKTIWAYGLYVVLVLGIMMGIFRYFWMRKSMRMQLETERVAKEKEREVHEMKQRFFIDISHELRTPLTLIVSPVQELLRTVYDRKVRKQLQLIENNVERLLHLINQLMDYRRAELGVFCLHVGKNEIHRQVEKIFFYYDQEARRKGVRYDMYSELEGQKVFCDADYIELILNNLISNALKYTKKGNSIVVSLKLERTDLVLQVEDTGSGIPSDKQLKVFERFYQADARHLGTGIGLSLVKRLVDLHHGRIELQSEEGKGSCFTIYLPQDVTAYTAEEMVEDGVVVERPVHTSNEPQMYLAGIRQEIEEMADEYREEGIASKKETILVVEDEKDINKYLCENLQKEYTVLTAFNGSDALDKLKEAEGVDLVLTDVMMPVMNGIQLCKAIKQNINTSHISVIFLSAKTGLEERLEGLEVGADDYIDKPFTMEVVLTKIRNLFRTRRQLIAYYNNQFSAVDIKKVAFNPLDGEFLQRAVEVVEKNLDNCNFTVEDFASEMCMNRMTLNVKIRTLTGNSSRDFIRKLRLDKASVLLKEGNYSVSDISVFVGFNTVSYFAHCFKKQFGCLPSEYKAKG